MRSLGRALIALAALALVMGLASITIILTSKHGSDRGMWAGVGAVLGWSFVATGLYAWWRRPDNHSGALMTAVGFMWFLAPLRFSDNDAIFAVGLFTSAIPVAGLAHLMLAFPSGRLESRYHRGLVAFGYFTATLLQLPGVLVYDTAHSSNCKGCPANPLLISSHSGLNDAWSALVNLCAVTVIALITREVIRRIRRARGSERQVYSPVIHAGGATLVASALLFASDPVGGPGAAALRLLAFAAFVTVPYAFLGGLIRGRLSRAGAVAELVEALGRADDQRRSLRDSIATALGDSSLTLAYWIPEQQAYVDAQGQRVDLPAPGSGRIATPVERGGAPLAVVVHDGALAEEGELVRAVGGAAALTLENERLAAELRARIEELRASRARIVQAADDARRRLERDLHDGAQQRLVALALNLKFARGSLEDDPAGARELIDDAIVELTEATAELRELARGIHPAILTDRGLDAAVNALEGRASLPVEVSTLPAERLAPPVESTAYFVVAEALTNVARYAQASHAEVDIDRDNGTLVVEVRDDGVGGAEARRGSGLHGLADRVAAVDGRLVVTSEPGAGTIVHAEIPCAP
jgi:signal transduction histidine kinase